MDFSIKACDWSKGSVNGFLSGKADVVVLGVFEAQTLTGPAREMDLATKGLLTRTVKAGDMDGKAGTTLFLHEVSGIGASRVLLVGLGKQDAFSQKAYGEADNPDHHRCQHEREENHEHGTSRVREFALEGAFKDHC